MSDSDFFAKYEKSEDELDEQMSEWESCSQNGSLVKTKMN